MQIGYVLDEVLVSADNFGRGISPKVADSATFVRPKHRHFPRKSPFFGLCAVWVHIMVKYLARAGAHTYPTTVPNIIDQLLLVWEISQFENRASVKR